MPDLYLTNTLTRKKEKFLPIKPPNVGLYTCGPTVYYYPQIGNWRTFVFEDILRRVLQFDGYRVKHVMNVTDVGHLTGDNIGDADLGEDRMEKAAKREGKTAWSIADFYITDFIQSREKLNILEPTHFVRATDHIAEQIKLIGKLENKGLTYVTPMGVYFAVAKYPGYGKLGGQKMIDKRVATRDELKEDPDKQSPFDFALWKFSKPEEKRHMEWESPWGTGFPGWHIECSAMSMKYLGDNFDIHTGGVDHIAIHHTNEIAQSEGATGKLFAKYWLHGEFLKVDGGRMGKSLGNAYTLHDIEEKGYDPLALRYLYLTANYRDTLNFTWNSLDAAQNALSKIRDQVVILKDNRTRTVLSSEKSAKMDNYIKSFTEAVNNDLNTPQALAVMWETVKSNIPSPDKYDLIMTFDDVLGLNLRSVSKEAFIIPDEIMKLAQQREQYRKQGNYSQADRIREDLAQSGYFVKDTPIGIEIIKK